ncbi:hypothetical protein ACWGID_00055 [Kribbella sp. NPDC054772]
MAPSKEVFEDLMRRSYPEAFERAQAAQSRLRFASPERLPDPIDRQAAVVAQLTADWQWMDDDDRNGLIQLANQGHPAVDLGNYIGYRSSQTIVPNPSTGGHDRYGPGDSEWRPMTEPPSTDPAELRAAWQHTAAMVAETVRSVQQVQQPARFLDAQPPAGTRSPLGDQGAVQHTGTRAGDQRQAGHGR